LRTEVDEPRQFGVAPPETDWRKRSHGSESGADARAITAPVTVTGSLPDGGLATASFEGIFPQGNIYCRSAVLLNRPESRQNKALPGRNSADGPLRRKSCS